MNVLTRTINIIDINEQEPDFEKPVLLFGSYVKYNLYYTRPDKSETIHKQYVGYKSSVTKNGPCFQYYEATIDCNFKVTHWAEIPQIN